MIGPSRIYFDEHNSDFNKLAFGETKADINREKREKNLERPGKRKRRVRGGGRKERRVGGGGKEGRGAAESSHRWPITPDNKHNLILYSFHLALRRGNPSPGIISDYLLAGQHTYVPAHTYTRTVTHSAHTHTHTHATWSVRYMRSCTTYLCPRDGRYTATECEIASPVAPACLVYPRSSQARELGVANRFREKTKVEIFLSLSS